MKIKRLFLIIGIGIVLTALISWFAFPTWSSLPGGLFQLLEVVTLGCLTAARDILAIVKDAKKLKAKSLASSDAAGVPERLQEVTGSKRVELTMKGKGGRMTQKVENSSDVTAKIDDR